MSTSGGNDSWPSHGLERVRRCPVCGTEGAEDELQGLTDTTYGNAPGEWALKRCSGCRSAYLDPRPTPESIGLAYTSYYTHAAARPTGTLGRWLRNAVGNSERNRLFHARLRPSIAGGWLLARAFPRISDRIRLEARGIERLGAPGRLLDVGCGNGEFLALAAQIGWSGYGVELDPQAAGIARSRGGKVIGARISELETEFDSFFDAVTLSQVIEHVHDPIEFLGHCRRVLRPGGYLWVETPNIDSIGYEIYGRFWRGLEPPRHLVVFNPSSLRSALGRAGFVDAATIPHRDVLEDLFARSARIKAGYLAEIETGSLPGPARRELAADIRAARRRAAADPGRSEFICAVAHRPPEQHRGL